MSNLTLSLQKAYKENPNQIVNVYLLIKDNVVPDIDGFTFHRTVFCDEIWIGKFDLSKMPQLKNNKDVIRMFLL